MEYKKQYKTVTELRQGIIVISDLIETRIASGTLLTTIEVLNFRTGRHPGAGIDRDEPLFDQWRAAIDACRQEIEDDPEIP